MPNKKIKRRPRQNPMTVKQWVDCINQRFRRHRSAILTEDIAFGHWLLDKKQELQNRGDLWGRVFKDRGMECSQATAEKYMSIVGNSVMRRFCACEDLATLILRPVPPLHDPRESAARVDRGRPNSS